MVGRIRVFTRLYNGEEKCPETPAVVIVAVVPRSFTRPVLRYETDTVRLQKLNGPFHGYTTDENGKRRQFGVVLLRTEYSPANELMISACYYVPGGSGTCSFHACTARALRGRKLFF